MRPIIIRLVVLPAIFMSAFLVFQLVIRLTLDRRTEKGAINRHLRLLRSGLNPDDVSYTLLKNAPPLLSPTAGWWERGYVSLIRMVMMSGISIEARTFLMGAIIAACGLFSIILLLALTLKSQVTFGLIQLVLVISAAIGVGIPLMVISRLAQRRRKQMQAQFPTALDVFIRGLRAGHPIASAIQLITHEMQDPIGSEFGLVFNEVSYGANLTDALLGTADRWDLEDMRMFVVCVSVQSETGGNLAEILQNLASVIRDRANMYMKVRALSSEGRTTGWMLSALPVFTIVSLFLYHPRFYLDASTDPIFRIGFPSLMVLYVIGVISIRKIIDIKV